MSCETRHHGDGARGPGRRLGARAAALLIGGAAAACAGLPLEGRIGDLRRQVDQLAKQRSDLVQEVHALDEVGREGHAAGSVGTPGAAGVTGPSELLDHYRRGYALYHQGDYAAAESALRTFLSAAPGDHPAAADARYWVGECYFARGLYREAIGAWGGLAGGRDGAARPDRAWLRIGAAYARLGETDLARHAFLEVTRRWPEGDSAPQAIEELGRLPAEP